jgi:glycosyltransferase involved in cell wall biosynthesis
MSSIPVSVVIPYYNRRRFIDECLESVFRQTVSPLEVIVVDDASEPAQRRYLDRFVPRIKVVALPRNQGAAGARNAGIAVAQGEWIAFQDSDDLWEPDKLAIQWDHVQQQPGCDGVQTAIRSFFHDGRESVSDPTAAQLTLEEALRYNVIRLQSLLIRASVLRAVGGFDPALRIGEDDDLGIRLALGGYRIDFRSQPLTSMRRWSHEHVSRDWPALIWDKAKVALLHRSHLERVLGPGATRRRVAYSARMAGHARGGLVGRLLYAGGWGLGGFDTTYD